VTVNRKAVLAFSRDVDAQRLKNSFRLSEVAQPPSGGDVLFS